MSWGTYTWVIPSEKTEKNWPPLKIGFFWSIITTGLVIDDLGHFWTPGAPGGPWGALGWFWGVWRTQNCPFPHGTNFDSEMSCFGSKQLVTLCFWYFGPNLGPQGQKKAILGQNRVCRKVHFPKKCHLKSCLYRTKTHVGDHILIWNIDFSGNALKIFHDGWFSVSAHKLPSLDEICLLYTSDAADE